MRTFCPLLLLSLTLTLAASEASYAPLSYEEMMEIKLPLERQTLVSLDKGWRLAPSDDLGFAAPDFDDSAWVPVEINKPLSGTLNQPKVWYRVVFTLDRPVTAGTVELDLGCISAGDEAYLNGKLCGSFGFSKVINGSSSRKRRYLISAADAQLKAGKNTLAIRVKNGYLRGMYRGLPRLSLLQGEVVFGKLAHRSNGRTAAFRQIAECEPTNRFDSGERLFVRPQIALVSDQETMDGVLRVGVFRENQRLESQELSVTLRRGHWLVITPLEFRNPGQGRYQVESAFAVQGKVLWSNRSSFTVENIPAYTVPVDAELAKAVPAPLPVKLGTSSFGSFGPRDLGEDGRLFDNYQTPEARAGLGAVLATNPKYPGPVFLHSNVKSPGDSWKFTDFVDAIGGYYDGLIDGWPAGWVRPEKNSQLRQISTVETNWAGKTIRFHYADDTFLDVRFSQLTPAFELSGTCSAFRILENGWGLGGPTALFGERAGQWHDLGKAPSQLETNYLVVSFRNSPGWDEFDIPYLVVFEKKTTAVKLTDNGLSVNFPPNGGGRLMLMPLYGVTLQSPDGPGPEALERCRFWARALPAMPVTVSRTAAIDYATDQLLVRDEFVRQPIQNEWGTQPLHLAPVPPSLVLAAAGKLDLSFSQAVTDTGYATLCGPFCAIQDTDSYVFELRGATRLVTEIRQAGPPTDTEATQNARQELERIVRQELMPLLTTHPWRRLTANPSGKANSSGTLEPDFTYLMLALPYLPEELRTQILHEIVVEQPSFFDNSLMAAVRKRGAKGKNVPPSLVPVNQTVVNPLSGKTMNALARHAKDNGIDCPCYEGLRLHLAWSLGHYARQWEFVASSLPALEQSFNLVVNGLDWSYSLCWDSYGGLRIGNGLQESTIFHAGLVGYARLLHHLGRREQSDQAACLALLLLPGMRTCTASATCDYNRRCRGYLKSHSLSSDIDFLETVAPDRYNEVNERGGFFPWVIHPRSFYSSGIIMTHLPEILRLFKECWGELSDRHFSVSMDGNLMSRTSPVRVDIFCHAVPHPPFAVEELLRLRQAQGTKLDCWQRFADLCAFLEYNSNISWHKLW